MEQLNLYFMQHVLFKLKVKEHTNTLYRSGMEGSERIKNMINGQCDCQHNTAGSNCERCIDFHHSLPWQPGDPNTGEAHACKGETGGTQVSGDMC